MDETAAGVLPLLVMVALMVTFSPSLTPLAAAPASILVTFRSTLPVTVIAMVSVSVRPSESVTLRVAVCAPGFA